MDSISKIKARDATIEDAAGIYALARELAETLGDSTPTEESVRSRLDELLDRTRPRPRRYRRRGADARRRRGPQTGRDRQTPDGGGAQRRFRQRRIPDRAGRHQRERVGP